MAIKVGLKQAKVRDFKKINKKCLFLAYYVLIFV